MLNFLRREQLFVVEQLAAQSREKELREAQRATQTELQQIEHRSDKEINRSFLAAEAVRDDLLAVQAQQELAKISVQEAEQALHDAEASRAEKEAALRALRETSGQSAAGQQGQAAALKLAEQEVRMQGALVAQRTQELLDEQLNAQLYQLREQVLNKRAETIGTRVVFTADDLQKKLAELDAEIGEINGKIEEIRQAREKLEERWSRLSAANNEPVERQKTKRLAHQTLDFELSALLQRQQLLTEMKGVWQRRYQVRNHKAQPELLRQWQNEANALIDQISQQLRLLSSRREQLRREFLGLEDRKRDTAHDLIAIRHAQQREIHRHLAALERMHEALERFRQMSEKLQSEILEQTRQSPLHATLSSAWEGVVGVWNYELVTTADNRPITVHKLLVGLVLFFVGMLLARKITDAVTSRVLPRFQVSPGGKGALQSLLFYLLIVFFTLFALHVANVPLTMFTVLGGAVAIGVGFGSQNIMNNFISGLILLIEQPIREGDVVELDGVKGSVQRIGARSTHIKTSTNIDILVPNSLLLERNVVNWTLGDNTVRLSIRVGIAYGADVDRVSALFRAIASEHPLVLREPQPFTVLAEFGDNALIVDFHFWVHFVSGTEAMQVESDLRKRIYLALQEAKIAIPFPQREVYLRALHDAERHSALTEKGAALPKTTRTGSSEGG